jgi:hypothetical protein
MGGMSIAPAAPSKILRGGCPGGKGGIGTGTTRTLGGPGGGAIYLVARGTLTINGAIDASGAGGNGGSSTKAGGGGGGSGGMIVIHAGTIALGANGAVAANGGGGGGGGGVAAGGSDGDDPIGNFPLMVASGGQFAMMGAVRGGDGAAGATPAKEGSDSAGGGGGGGGGGLGQIRVLKGGTIPAGQVSPTPTN